MQESGLKTGSGDEEIHIGNEEEIHIGNKERIISLIVLSLILITFWTMMDLVLLTFILSFIFYNLLITIQNRGLVNLKINVPDWFILTVMYLMFVVLLTIGSIVLAPKIVTQFGDLANMFFNIDTEAFRKELGPNLYNLVAQIDIKSYLEQAGALAATIVTKIGYFSLSLFISIILSFIILLEKNKITEFGQSMANSKLHFMYEYFRYFGKNFAHTFGKVMKVQVTIAFINSMISMIVLSVLGFPGILGLGTMIFGLGLIPVAGAAISLIPLTVVAFSVGGIAKIVQVVVLILVIHGLEAYILNPKLMSTKTRLPVCFVFIILLVGEHYLGVWGLLIGVPIFVFFMSIFKIEYKGNHHVEYKRNHPIDPSRREI